MKNIKKAVVLLLSVMVIVVAANVTFASTIQPRNTTEDENVSNTENEDTNTANSTNNVANNVTTNTPANTVSNLSTNTNVVAGNTSRINSTNTTQNIPKTGIEDTYLNFALFLLLAVVLGMFSLVQYNKIVKKED